MAYVDPREDQRLAMVKRQIEGRGIHQERLLQVLRSVPRHWFVPDDLQTHAYDDCPLSLGYGQTISQPYIVALMSELLCLEGAETVLEIGTGSGYQAAVLAGLARSVYSVEMIPQLAEQARRTLQRLALTNLTVITGDGSVGLPEFAPYNGILVTAAAPRVPQKLLEQLAPQGKLILPVGERFVQNLELWQKVPGGFNHETITPVAFVPLRGEYGWDKDSYL